MTEPDGQSIPESDPQPARAQAAASQAGQAPAPQRRAWQAPAMVALFLAITLGVLGLDLWSKSWSFANVAPGAVLPEPADPQYVAPHHGRELVPGVLHLRLTLNEGAVFGIGQGQRWLFVLVSVLAVGIIGTIFARSSARAWPLHVGLALILGGALGNLYDRLQYGAVRDMLLIFPNTHLPLGLNWPGGRSELWPWIFNVADAALVAGVALVILLMWVAEFRHRRVQQQQAD